jgi:orotate phosphoribosyltransferase
MSSSEKMASQIAESLLEIGAVTLRPQQPFTWASGIQSPIYCDNRLTMSYPIIRELIAQAFVQTINTYYPQTAVIAGTATAGIPHAAWVSQKLDLPMIYVRDKAKGHGKENMIEGLVSEGQPVVVIEDLISTGGSSLKAAQAVQASGAKVLAVIAIFTYEFTQALEAFAEAGIPLHTLTNYSTLIDIALEHNKIQSSDVSLLKAWRENPKAY